MNTVKVGLVPGAIKEYAVEDRTSAKTALEIAEINTTGYVVRLNGDVVTDLEGTLLRDGDSLLVTRQIKGNRTIMVKAGKVPGAIAEYAVESGSTVETVLEAAEIETTGFTVRLNGDVVTDFSGTRLSDGDSVLVTRQIKGNNRMITVKAGKVPGQIGSYVVEVIASVKDVLDAAEIDVTGHVVRLNGDVVTDLENTQVNDGDSVLVTRQIKGNK